MNYFPTRLAIADAFCNREDEIKRLIANIQGVNPVLIMSPRRYGKTSLALNVLEYLKFPYVHIDLYKELSEKDIENAILNGIGKLIVYLEKTPKRLLKLANEIFSNLQIKIGLEEGGLSLDLSRGPKEQKKSADILLTALEKLQALAKQRNKIVILFIDEFQIVGEVLKTHSIEAAIREAAQKSTNVMYIFSGSNRHLLSEMFYDKKRPLYKLCDIIILDRISRKSYEKFIQNAALEKWQKKLSTEALDMIFQLTERHSYYINKLCSLLWMNDFPNETIVQNTWHEYALDNTSMIAKEIEGLSLNQRKLLVHLARHEPVKEIFSSDYMSNLEIPPGSINQALKKLKEKDYIFEDERGIYRVVDPLLKTVLSS